MAERTRVIDRGRPGPPGPPGPTGPAGTGAGVETVVPTASATWTIAHSFPRHPSVVVLVGGEEWDTDVHFSTGQVVVTFATPQSGSVVLS
jgi:hypothetical protein